MLQTFIYFLSIASTFVDTRKILFNFFDCIHCSFNVIYFIAQAIFCLDNLSLVFIYTVDLS